MTSKRTLLPWLSRIAVAAALLAASVTPAGASTLADFEGGLPAGWFTFFGGSTVTTVTQTVTDSAALARPGQVGDNEILSADYNVTDFGGFGQDLVVVAGGPQDWSSQTGFSFWFYGTASGLTYQAEVSDNRSNPNADTSERFDYEFTDITAGWQLISIPWTDFTRATDFQPGGAPDDGFTLTEIWAWAIVLPQGVDTVYFDDFTVVDHVIDDFESGVAPGTSCAGPPLGFCTFQGAGSSVSIVAATTPPAPLLPALGEPNTVIQVDLDVTSFAGFIRGFTNAAGDTWVSQDWSAYGGFAIWIYGNNSGTQMFIDLLENRNPGSTTDDAERWTVTLLDDFSGWRYFEFPFDSFVRKGIGNGAPNDTLTLTEVHGWAFGTLGTGGSVIFYLDQVSLFGVAELPELTVGFTAPNYDVTEGDTGSIVVKLNRTMVAEDPAQVSVDYAIEPGSAVPDRDYVSVPASGTLTFVSGGPSALSFDLQTIDNNKHDGDKRVILRLSNPVDVTLSGLQASGTILDDEPFDPTLVDDFEDFPYLWDSTDNVILSDLEIPAGDPLEVPGQGDFEGVLSALVPLLVEIDHPKKLCNTGNGVVPVILFTSADFDATTVDHTTVKLGDAYETHVDAMTGGAKRHEEDADFDGDIDLVFHFRYNETGLPCKPEVVSFSGFTFDGQPITAGGADARLGRNFPLGQDWSAASGLRFWYYGQNTGDTIVVELLDNRAPDPGPSGWSLVWSDEFNGPAGAPPDPATWGHEIGDGTVNGIPGWGNSELEYYTDSTENAAQDGNGNLVITAREADGSLGCYYGPCEYTSARLLTQHRAEFAYGRIESRILLPDGADGLWAAFWSLGTDIGEVGWPQTGEIDFMEYVSRLPNEIFGTIHGPGYSGGQSFGNVYNFTVPASDEFHTFAIEWQPNLIKWYVDGILYHEAEPADVAPNEWVFNDPVFLLLNLAVGGNFGGPVSDDTVFPQSMTIDYLRIYQGPDTAERFETSFVDNFSGWQEVVIPFDSFVRSAEQPDGAPDDGLGLTEVWGYGFRLPEGSSSGSLLIASVRLDRPLTVTVTNLNDSGPGSLRRAIELVLDGGTIFFDPGLAGGTIALTSGPLTFGKSLTIDGADAPGLTLSGGNVDRVLIVDAGATVEVDHLTLADGYGFQLAGCVLNNGTLTLDHVTVTGCAMTTTAGDFWQGGGGIYNGEGATFNLIDSTVSNNNAGWSGGGVYSFFNTSTTILRSTISSNVSNDVGGGFRLLGNAEIVNSTISGNEATGWYGGALFLTDGVVNMTNSTVADNVSPVWAPADVFVGTFGPTSATLNVINSIVSSAQDGCFLAPFGAGAVAINSLGNNVFTDGTCFPVGSDLIVVATGLDALADNGGPTLTHALTAGSPAIDAGDNGVCPATDQRGVARPQGAACDVGAYEYVP
jgi:beta-glucanase (GH16 family)